MKITYFGKKILFPIREGLDRLTWDMAKAVKGKGFDVEIRCMSNKRKVKYIDGICITEDKLLPVSCFKTDIIHFLVHPNPEIIPVLFLARAKRILMTIADGEMGGFWKKWWSPFIIYLIKKKIAKIFVQTQYQKKQLDKLKLDSKIILPYIDAIKKKGTRKKPPSLLYMGVPSRQKGFIEMVEAFYKAKKIVNNLKLIIADSHIKNAHRLDYSNLQKEKDISIKKNVDRELELSNAWIYIYPIRSPQNTMSIPLSLMESVLLKTAFISTNIGGLPEIFSEEFLVEPKNSQAISEKIIRFIKNYPKNIQFKKKIENKKIIQRLLEEYRLK